MTLSKSEALFVVARAAYLSADRVSPEAREELLSLALDLDERAVRARDVEEGGDG